VLSGTLEGRRNHM